MLPDGLLTDNEEDYWIGGTFRHHRRRAAGQRSFRFIATPRPDPHQYIGARVLGRRTPQ
jgi:hypothetical protein